MTASNDGVHSVWQVPFSAILPCSSCLHHEHVTTFFDALCASNIAARITQRVDALFRHLIRNQAAYAHGD